jgi:ubiquinone/menaquinone biosynthesis C-methylase UbiE
MTSTSRDPVATAYDDWSNVYDADANATRDLNAEVLRAEKLEATNADVLELGCGTGINTVWLAASARSVVALDFSPGMLAKACERVSAQHVRFVQHDIREPWPVEDAAFDLVVATLVLEHIDELQPFFHQLKRVLRTGGMAFLSELHPERQLRGSQGQFTTAQGTTVRVVSILHHVSDYVNAGVAAGLHLVEKRDRFSAADIAKQAPPRLLTLTWRNGSS